MHKIATARRVPAAFGVFWNSSFGPVPCEAYTIDGEGNTTSGDDATAEDLAFAYARGETFLTYEAFSSEEAATARAIECGNRYIATPLRAGWYFYDGEQLCVVAPAEPAKLGASAPAAHTPGPWRAIKGHETIVGKGGMFVADLMLGQSSHHTPEIDANARLIAAAPDMLAELRRLFELYGHQATADVIRKATGQ